ncbi:hypothetical protein A2572_01470 [Candidatus Collierbacteria bacterium RIFOXYD1_FULL_40_9]|uniref:Metal-dependent hydrolase n=1 Tax=Candidatus Collierbacteria bacterium RIFOXYD1_FULL_40_9 TaxID=1817731 RepID=A0A1F5FVN0_9BACT|nr:MAG: hypothetical protein A2572_01470 [Candidatus Collierbacteria bacterium RIFOXYD1_FULL_40_9]
MKKITIATHGGFYHADDLFAVATLKLILEKDGKKVEIVRTRDLKLALKCDYCVDVGREYNPVKNRYDHHQVDETLIRENSIPYAAFGLIWKHFGQHLVSSKEIQEIIEKKLVQPIDAMDNAVTLSTKNFENINEYNIASAIYAISQYHGVSNLNESFYTSLELCKQILVGEINQAEDKHKSRQIVNEEIKKQNTPSILILDKYHTWKEVVLEYPTIKFVLYPDINTSNWYLQPAKNTKDDFGGYRANFPVSWLGKEHQELAEVSGIEEAVFCHKSGYLAVAKTKESGIKLAMAVLNLQS